MDITPEAGSDPISPGLDHGRSRTGSDLISPKLSSTASLASQWQYAEPSQTLIFLDWDDTLFPTTEVMDRWGVPPRPELWSKICLSEEQESALGMWREALLNFLNMTCSLSNRVVILTNSRRPWVTDCAARFAPDVLPLLEGSDALRVVYAHEVLSKSRRKNPRPVFHNADAGAMNRQVTPEEHAEVQTNSKYVAMKGEVLEFYSQYEDQTWKNIVSYGDMRYERDALQEVTFTRVSPMRETVRTKTITLPAKPTIGMMIFGLSARVIYFPVVVRFNGDLDVVLCNSIIENAKILGNALNMPELLEVDEELSEDLCSLQQSLDSTLNTTTISSHSALIG